VGSSVIGVLQPVESWGRLSRERHRVVGLHDRHRVSELMRASTLPGIAYGNGRSYGDVCLNPGGTLWMTRGLNHFIAFDDRTGLLTCEAGVTLEEILRVVVPRGWFLPVTPGTWHVTVGGAIANDVHGKNHHRQGSFGNHVLRFELLRSDGERRICTRERNADWFAATIGGLGLTGIITWAELRLRQIANAYLHSETRRFRGIDEFIGLSEEADSRFEYTVAWIDCVGHKKGLERGLFMRANHLEGTERDRDVSSNGRLTVPFALPVSAVNRLTLRLFNALYYYLPKRAEGVTRFEPFFYPLDGIGHWNRLYGRKGFVQYQFVLPISVAQEGIKEMLRAIGASGLGSPLAVLKVFGEQRSVGWLSFPRAGITLALDFPVSEKCLTLLDNLDLVVREAGGAVYPAKDARMKGEIFRDLFPQWEQIEKYRDPAILSSFWKRVTRDQVR
jgi:FAD/FMN-containing dehydrogenase